MATYKPQKPLAERLTKKTLEQLQKRKITNAEAAAQYGVSETYMCRVVASLQAKIPGPTMEKRKAAAALVKTRRQVRTQLAKRILAGTLTYAKAIKEANCSERTMRRFVSAYRQPTKEKRNARN